MPVFAPIIRRAHAADAPILGALMNAGMTHNVQRLTMLGSPLLSAWVGDQLLHPGGDTFFLAEVNGEPAGMASTRLVDTTLVVNHLYTSPAFQRCGAARALLTAVVESTSATRIALDVFSESRVARQWYAKLGFTTDFHRVWLETRLATEGAASEPAGSISGLPEADAAQARHGFSQFVLKTPSAEYGIGRLGDAVFRTRDFAILHDTVALRALATLDPRRSLICIGAPEDLPEDAAETSRVVERSQRLSVPRMALREKLHAAH